jgi:hypothetical protein
MITRQEGIVLASRAFGFYLTVWGLVEVTYLPQALLSFLHHAGPRDYLWTYYGLNLSIYLVRVVGLLVAARWLLKGGTAVAEFFLPRIDSES